jgi:uncharacterized protein (DUF2141 family)
MKQMPKPCILFIFICLCGGGLFSQQKFDLTITINGFKNQKGTVKLQVQNAQQKEVFQKIAPVPGKTYLIVINDVPEGAYVVNVIHDKNNNNKLDTNWMGIPSEGWGCSNDARGFMSAPAFRNKLFPVKGNTSISINLVHY